MRTSMTIDRASMRQLAAAMAFVMMIASIPAMGVIIVADRSGPSISLDICHPLQSSDRSPGVAQIARPAPPEIGAAVLWHETRVQFVAFPKSRLAEAPDPPPPKQFC
jgi:hypothetical protein